ncbi:MAG: pyridoxal-5'-phosphate-dependent protein [Robiginitomaculum sp.]|nr:MAG: pyridoxal-5'-phosphate-dependent protein [Robiginitomaculum sp.]
MIPLPTIDDVRAAVDKLAGDALVTPLLRSDQLDRDMGRPVWIKAECLQYTGSFKYRGARNRILNLSAQQQRCGVVAYSSGNHAQGVALAALRDGISCCIVMPADTPKVKVAGVRARKSEVVFYDRLTENRAEIAAELAERSGAILIPPYDDFYVIAGQGTVGLEIAEQGKAMGVVFEQVVTNCGGGGLTAGIALALEKDSPQTDLYAAEPADFDDYGRSLRSGKRERNPILSGSICDALMADTPGEMTFAINQPRVCDGLRVTDEEVRSAMAYAFSHLQVVLEPGGAASLAAALQGRVPGKGPLCIVATGGNVDPALFCQVIAP